MQTTLHSLIAQISWRRTLPVVAVCLLLIVPSLTLAFQLMGQGRAQGIACPTATAQPTPSATGSITTPSPTMVASPTPTTTSLLGTYYTPITTSPITGTQTPTPTATPPTTGAQAPTPTPTAPVLCTPTPCPTTAG